MDAPNVQVVARANGVDGGWECAPKRAWAWAEQRRRRQKWDEEVAALGLMIRLGNCLGLLGPDKPGTLTDFHREYGVFEKELGGTPKQNSNRLKMDSRMMKRSASGLDKIDGLGRP